MNRQVQCPACRHQFHPAEAVPVENVRAAAKPDYANAKASEAMPGGEPRPAAKLPPAPTPPADFDVRKSGRRGKRETEDVCPKCRAFVPRGVNKCPECQAEFEPEDDENFRPWEQDGMERRDSEPHRGTMLLLMGIGSLLLACTFFICYLGVVSTIVGLVMGLVAAGMAYKDLGKIARHEMDRDGHGMTQFGLWSGIIGAVLNVFAIAAAIALTVMVS
jgi:hypothetical protein